MGTTVKNCRNKLTDFFPLLRRSRYNKTEGAQDSQESNNGRHHRREPGSWHWRDHGGGSWRGTGGPARR